MDYKMFYIVRAPRTGFAYRDDDLFRIVVKMDKGPTFRMNFGVN